MGNRAGSSPAARTSGDAPAGNPYPAPSFEGAFTFVSSLSVCLESWASKVFEADSGMAPAGNPYPAPCFAGGPFRAKRARDTTMAPRALLGTVRTSLDEPVRTKLTGAAAARSGAADWPGPAWPGRTEPGRSSWCSSSFPWPYRYPGYGCWRRSGSQPQRPGC